MKTNVKNLLKQASGDVEFQNELKQHEPEYYKVGIFWSKIEKVTYASIYMGWLVGKGRYNESDFM